MTVVQKRGHCESGCLSELGLGGGAWDQYGGRVTRIRLKRPQGMNKTSIICFICQSSSGSGRPERGCTWTPTDGYAGTEPQTLTVGITSLPCQFLTGYLHNTGVFIIQSAYALNTHSTHVTPPILLTQRSLGHHPAVQSQYLPQLTEPLPLHSVHPHNAVTSTPIHWHVTRMNMGTKSTQECSGLFHYELTGTDEIANEGLAVFSTDTIPRLNTALCTG